MKVLLILGIYYFVVTFGLLAGTLMLLWPGKFRELTDRIGASSAWSKSNTEWKPGLEIEWRLAGLIIMVGAGFMLKPIIWTVLVRRPREAIHVEPFVATSVGADWFAFGIGVLMMLGGVWMLARPRAVVRWAASTRPQRTFTEEALRRGTIGVRIVGALLSANSLLPLYLWFKSL